MANADLIVGLYLVVIFLLPSNGRLQSQRKRGIPKYERGLPVKEMEAVNIVLGAAQHQESLIFITATGSSFHDVAELQATSGVGVFEVGVDSLDGNMTQIQLSRVVGQAQQLQQVLQSLMFVVMSDDSHFLATFAELFFKGRLLVWSTRLLVLTHLPLQRLHDLRKTLAMTNSMLLHIPHTTTQRCSVYVDLPYSPSGAKLLPITSWTGQGKHNLTSYFPLFPEKFNTLSVGPRLKVARLLMPTYTRYVDDPDNPGERLIVDPRGSLLEAISRAMNFSITYIESVDGTFGSKLPNGSWTGMIGMTKREEVDFAQGIFITTYIRVQAMDITFPVTIENSRLIANRGSPEVDPWSFLLPITPLVWVSILVALLGVVTVMMVLPSCFPLMTLSRTKFMTNTANCVRVLLQQDVCAAIDWWWWERVVLGVWMLMTLVLTRSYAGNLMSLLAVRYIPMPIQTLQDVLDNPVKILVLQKSALSDAFTRAEVGIMVELREKENLKPVHASNLKKSMDTLVRRGEDVLVLPNTNSKMLMSHFYSETGKCDFYLAREHLIPMVGGLGVPKGSPLAPALNHRIMQVNEAGLYIHWIKTVNRNFTKCLNLPKKVAVKSTLGISNTWGMLVVLAGGEVASLIVLCLEFFYFHISH